VPISRGAPFFGMGQPQKKLAIFYLVLDSRRFWDKKVDLVKMLAVDVLV
jgi:hypothetical protein